MRHEKCVPGLAATIHATLLAAAAAAAASATADGRGTSADLQVLTTAETNDLDFGLASIAAKH